jgi:hypothetical protein
MHPRNIYKNRPNFKQLAISYPEFRKFTKQVIGSKHKELAVQSESVNKTPACINYTVR